MYPLISLFMVDGFAFSGILCLTGWAGFLPDRPREDRAASGLRVLPSARPGPAPPNVCLTCRGRSILSVPCVPSCLSGSRPSAVREAGFSQLPSLPGLCLKLEVAPGPSLVPLLRPLPSCRELCFWLLARLGRESAWHAVIRRRCCRRGAPRGREGWAMGAQRRAWTDGGRGSSGRCPRDPKPSPTPFSVEEHVGRVLPSYPDAASLGSDLQNQPCESGWPCVGDL
eukprot:XP_028342461.1 uncharacterized protein LOC114485357 [Physeter catodon]